MVVVHGELCVQGNLIRVALMTREKWTAQPRAFDCLVLALAVLGMRLPCAPRVAFAVIPAALDANDRFGPPLSAPTTTPFGIMALGFRRGGVLMVLGILVLPRPRV